MNSIFISIFKLKMFDKKLRVAKAKSKLISQFFLFSEFCTNNSNWLIIHFQFSGGVCTTIAINFPKAIIIIIIIMIGYEIGSRNFKIMHIIIKNCGDDDVRFYIVLLLTQNFLIRRISYCYCLSRRVRTWNKEKRILMCCLLK